MHILLFTGIFADKPCETMFLFHSAVRANAWFCADQSSAFLFFSQAYSPTSPVSIEFRHKNSHAWNRLLIIRILPMLSSKAYSPTSPVSCIPVLLHSSSSIVRQLLTLLFLHFRCNSGIQSVELPFCILFTVLVKSSDQLTFCLWFLNQVPLHQRIRPQVLLTRPRVQWVPHHFLLVLIVTLHSPILTIFSAGILANQPSLFAHESGKLHGMDSTQKHVWLQ